MINISGFGYSLEEFKRLKALQEYYCDLDTPLKALNEAIRKEEEAKGFHFSDPYGKRCQLEALNLADLAVFLERKGSA